MQKNLGISLNDLVLAELDRCRGRLPRSTAIQMVLEEKLGMNSPSELAGPKNGE